VDENKHATGASPVDVNDDWQLSRADTRGGCCGLNCCAQPG
jgi:hypothetical protein